MLPKQDTYAQNHLELLLRPTEKLVERYTRTLSATGRDVASLER